MNDQEKGQILLDFFAHLDSLAGAHGVKLDEDARRAIFDKSLEKGGLSPATTIDTFLEHLDTPVDDWNEDEDLDWDEPPDYDGMTSDEINQRMVERARELDPPHVDENRTYDLSNSDDFVDYAVQKMNGMEFEDTPDTEPEAA